MASFDPIAVPSGGPGLFVSTRGRGAGNNGIQIRREPSGYRPSSVFPLRCCGGARVASETATAAATTDGDNRWLSTKHNATGAVHLISSPPPRLSSKSKRRKKRLLDSSYCETLLPFEHGAKTLALGEAGVAHHLEKKRLRDIYLMKTRQKNNPPPPFQPHHIIPSSSQPVPTGRGKGGRKPRSTIDLRLPCFL